MPRANQDPISADVRDRTTYAAGEVVPLDALEAMLGAARLAGYAVVLEPTKIRIRSGQIDIHFPNGIASSGTITVDGKPIGHLVTELNVRARPGAVVEVKLTLESINSG